MKNKMKKRQIEKIARCLGISLDYLNSGKWGEKYDERYLTDKQFLTILKRFRRFLRGNVFIHPANDHGILSPEDAILSVSYDATSIIGLCNSKPILWRPSELMYPEILASQTVVPKYRRRYQLCPLRTKRDDLLKGCYYFCALNRQVQDSPPSLNDVLTLYEKEIARWQRILEADV